jgi:predicted nucleotidyltransferase
MAGSTRDDLDRRLERFATAVADAAGDNLVALVLYGSAAAGHHTPRSDVNLLLVLRDASAVGLRALGPAFRDWVRSGERAPLVFSETGWRSAADVFPIEIEDIRHRHRILRGSDPVAGLRTTPEHLRHQLEREARGLLIQLRASYAASASDGRALAAVVTDSVGSVLALFRALLRLRGATVPDDPAALVTATAEVAGLGARALAWAVAQRTAPKPTRLAPYDPIAAQYLDAVQGFVDFVDRS